MAPPSLRFFATCPRGLADLLAEELRALGASAVREGPAGASFRGDLVTGYRACLWSRVASRVLLALLRIEAEDADSLYQGIYELPWEDHMSVDGTLAVDAVGTGAGIHHGRYAAQKVKDAVVDRFRRSSGRRPSVSPERPDLRLHLHLEGPRATLSLDLAGESLHRRGYRLAGVEAPVKENLGAGLLLRAGWPAVAARGGALLDPMCGSGTLPIEAALMATDRAPGLGRAYWGFLGWRGHRPEAWEGLLQEARERARAGAHRGPPIFGYDEDTRAIAAARENARAAGVGERVRLEPRALAALGPPAAPPGLVVVNPPYGERLGEAETLRGLYQTLGLRLRDSFAGWQAAVLTADEALGRAIGLAPQRHHRLWNGPIECQLLRFSLEAPPARREHPPRGPDSPLSPGASMLANRLRKNLATIGRWARRQGIGCYRLYDADMPEYAVAIDLYRGADLRVQIQEYAPPATVDPDAAARRLDEVMAVLPGLLEVPRSHLYLKVRRRQRPTAQYSRLGSRGELFAVAEGPCQFLINLADYLDTGLFLDHRETRRLLAGLSAGRRFLNLFAYTATATVCAAHGGAIETTSVDLSPTYLGWARRNLDVNGLTGPRHQLLQADCLDWLEREAASVRRGLRYELAFIDPPTFSNSKRTRRTLDVQRDHVRLIRLAARLLAPGSVLIFSTHLRGFCMDRDAIADLDPEDITARTIPRDFERNPRIHQCWLLRVG